MSVADIRENKDETLAQEIRQRMQNEVVYTETNKMGQRQRNKSIGRFEQQKRKDTEVAESMLMAKDYQRANEEEVKFAEALAAELDRRKRDEIREKRMRQQLRESSTELRDLETKLRAAYINKQLMAQLAEREAERMREKNEKKRVSEHIENARLSSVEFEKQKLREEALKKMKYREELQDQMILLDQKRLYDYEELLLEKKQQDETLQRVSDEDQRELAEKKCRMEKTRQEIEAFKVAQSIWREKERKAMEEENRRIEEFLKTCESTQKERQLEKEHREAAKNKIADDLAKKLYEQEQQRKEKEDLMQELMEEERKEMEEQRHRDEMKREIQKKVDTKDSLTRQMQDIEERKRFEAEQDAKFREQMLIKMAEDERVELMSNEKKRRKMLEIRKSIEQMISERRRARAEEMQVALRLEEEEKKEEAKRQQMIEEERLRMLKEHTPNLMGYFPPGVLRPGDLSLLGTD